MGAVHFTVTSSEHDYSPGSDQHSWVLADLSSVDRSVTPWIVFTSHRPLYTAACSNLPLQHACQIESPVFQALQVAWEDVLILHNVTLAATAHIHYYERTCAVAHGVCANSSSSPASPRAAAAAQVKPQPAPAGAPVYIVVGPAGAMLLLMRACRVSRNLSRSLWTRQMPTYTHLFPFQIAKSTTAATLTYNPRPLRSTHHTVAGAPPSLLDRISDRRFWVFRHPCQREPLPLSIHGGRLW